MLQLGKNCWRIERANRAAMIVDAAGYFHCALRAMLKAKQQIILIGWDFDTRIILDREPPEPGVPLPVGKLFSWLAKRRPDLKIHILPWDEGMLHVPGRGTTALRLARWAFDKQIFLKWDGSHPLNGSHHHKILVIDDSIAFCGGIDITAERWDTREHRDKEPLRKRPFTHRSYDPWHDAIMAVDGRAARALGDLARKRWSIATGQALPVPEVDHDAWPEELDANFTDVPIAIARTRAQSGEYGEVREVEALFIDLVKAARKTVYIETQYFSSRTVAEAIAARLQEPSGPEFVVINPREGRGWLDEGVMGPARYELLKVLRERDRHGRFRIYSPVTDRGCDIYVHAKIMIVDDLLLRVGSANLNNRSMGLDSECDLLIDARKSPPAKATIRRIRADLLAEHLGLKPDECARACEEAGSLIEAIEKLRGRGRTLVPLDPEEPPNLQKAMARSELLDPEGSGELFEPRARPGLLSRLGRR